MVTGAVERCLRVARPAGAVLMLACLPRHAQLQPDGRESDRYSVVLHAELSTAKESAFEVPPVVLERRGELALSWARGWRDGSVGRLVELSLDGTLAEDGGSPMVLPAITTGRLEMRAFPDGQMLALVGAEPWVGGDGHLEVFEPLWWMLTPPAPDEAEGDSRQSWTWSLQGLPPIRYEQRLSWTRTNKRGSVREFSYRGDGDGRSAVMQTQGTLQGSARFDGARLTSHTLDTMRTVSTRWPAGTVVQVQRLTLTVQWVGVGQAPPLRYYPYDDALAETAPLALATGEEIGGSSVDVLGDMPFLVAPDAVRARLRAVGLP